MVGNLTVAALGRLLNRNPRMGVSPVCPSCGAQHPFCPDCTSLVAA
jgi:hypothetical protein